MDQAPNAKEKIVLSGVEQFVDGSIGTRVQLGACKVLTCVFRLGGIVGQRTSRGEYGTIKRVGSGERLEAGGTAKVGGQTVQSPVDRQTASGDISQPQDLVGASFVPAGLWAYVVCEAGAIRSGGERVKVG